MTTLLNIGRRGKSSELTMAIRARKDTFCLQHSLSRTSADGKFCPKTLPCCSLLSIWVKIMDFQGLPHWQKPKWKNMLQATSVSFFAHFRLLFLIFSCCGQFQEVLPWNLSWGITAHYSRAWRVASTAAALSDKIGKVWVQTQNHSHIY